MQSTLIAINYHIHWQNPPSAFQRFSSWSSLYNISIYMWFKYQAPILQSEGAALPQYFGVGKYAHAPISHNIKRQFAPSAFYRLSFRSSLHNILIYEWSKNQGPILSFGGISRRRNFWVKYKHMQQSATVMNSDSPLDTMPYNIRHTTLLVFS